MSGRNALDSSDSRVRAGPLAGGEAALKSARAESSENAELRPTGNIPTQESTRDDYTQDCQNAQQQGGEPEF